MPQSGRRRAAESALDIRSVQDLFDFAENCITDHQLNAVRFRGGQRTRCGSAVGNCRLQEHYTIENRSRPISQDAEGRDVPAVRHSTLRSQAFPRRLQLSPDSRRGWAREFLRTSFVNPVAEDRAQATGERRSPDPDQHGWRVRRAAGATLPEFSGSWIESVIYFLYR